MSGGTIMRGTAMLLALLIGVGPVVAQDKCALIGRIAENSMKIRQADRLLSEAVATIKAKLPNDPEGAQIMVDLLVEAYGHPLYASKRAKEDSIRAFRNEVETACYSM